MKPNNKIFDYILITLAIFSISYFILLILNSRFITSYILYLIFACICILYSYYELKNKTSILSKLPKIINYIIKGIICISIILFVIIEGLIINEANNSYCKQKTCILHKPSVIAEGAAIMAAAMLNMHDCVIPKSAQTISFIQDMKMFYKSYGRPQYQ